MIKMYIKIPRRILLGIFHKKNFRKIFERYLLLDLSVI